MSDIVDLYAVTLSYGLAPAYIGPDLDRAKWFIGQSDDAYSLYQFPAVVIHQGKKRLP
jgi:hypothetical protein